MNELIKDLGLKAAYQFDLDDPKFLQKYSEKFAELIVNECVAQIIKEPFSAGAAATYIKQHFGVE